MAVSKLNPWAPPFFCANRHGHLLPPPLPPPMPLCHAVACSPPFPFVAATTYAGAPFPVPAPQYPPQAPAPPASPPVICKRVPFLPSPLRGRPPHKLMTPKLTIADQKRQAQAAAKERAAAGTPVQEPPAAPAARRPRKTVVLAAAQADTAMAPVQEPPAPTAALRPRRAALLAAARARVPRLHRQEAIARSKNHMAPRKAAAAVTLSGTARPPPPQAATDERLQGSDTTVMVRNIPNKLTFGEMMRFLDEHCARMNQQRGAPLAYDFLYVPIDFRMSCGHRSSNYGYAFVNLTTPKAARRMQRSLSGFPWKFFGSQKVIQTCRAKIQGKDALEQRLSRITFACHTDEFLPAVFSPPRDGGAGAGAGAGDPKPPKRIGKRAPDQLAGRHAAAAVKPSS